MYKLLIVDDEYLERQALKMMLSDMPKIGEIYEAENGLEAVEIVKQKQIDLIFMDIKMPKMDGIEASAIIREINPMSVIIILTAFADFELARRAIRIHANDYLLKPARPEKLEEMLTYIAPPLIETEKKDYLQLFKRALLKGQVRETRENYKILINKEVDEQDEIRQILTIILESVDFYDIHLDKKSALELQSMAQKRLHIREYLEFIDLLLNKVFSQIVGKKLASYDREIDYALNYIEFNLTKELSLESVSEYMNISPHYFSKLFKHEVGDNFVQYVTQRKIEIASERLAKTNDPIVSIAFDLGFNEANYFSKVFKKIIGLSPNEFRRSKQDQQKLENALLSRYYAGSNSRWII